MFPLIRRLWVREVQKQREGALSVLKGWLDINPHPHTCARARFYMKRSTCATFVYHIMIVSLSSKHSRLPFPYTGGLVNPHYYLHLPNDRRPCPSTVPFQPKNSQARRQLRSPLSEFLPRLYSQPLKVHSLARRHREKNQKMLKAGSDHR